MTNAGSFTIAIIAAVAWIALGYYQFAIGRGWLNPQRSARIALYVGEYVAAVACLFGFTDMALRAALG